MKQKRAQEIGRVVMPLVISGLLLALDLWTKSLVYRTIRVSGPKLILPHILEFYYVENTGAAFNILDQKRLIFLIIAAVAAIGIVYILVKTRHTYEGHTAVSIRILHICCILILAGAIGNAVDRAVRGFVVDFIRVLFIDFPVFNVADCYVVVGCLLLLVLCIFRKGTLEDIERSVFSHE